MLCFLLFFVSAGHAAADCAYCPPAGIRPLVAPRFAPPRGFVAVGAATDPYSGLPKTIRHLATGYRLVLIPEGFHLVGGASARIVGIAAVWIGEREVSRREYLGRERDESAAAMTGIDWRAAKDWSGRHGMRLPTEDEWEVAGGGPSALPFPWGEEWRPAAAGRRDRSGFGVIGMATPPAEWCASPSLEDEDRRAVRGDFTTDTARRVGLAARRKAAADRRSSGIGFRAAVDPVALR